MPSRAELKYKAREALKVYYVEALIVCLLLSLFDGTVETIMNFGRRTVQVVTESGSIQTFTVNTGRGSFLIFLLTILVGNILIVGAARYFLQSRNELSGAGVGILLEGFKDGRYPGIMFAMLMRYVFIFLFTLLLIIPGIIKYYEYRMVPYVLADNPYMDWQEALERSKTLMNGHKMEAFILELSFIGWMLLGVLTFGIVTVLVRPYIEATFTELYVSLKKATPGYMN